MCECAGLVCLLALEVPLKQDGGGGKGVAGLSLQRGGCDATVGNGGSTVSWPSGIQSFGNISHAGVTKDQFCVFLRAQEYTCLFVLCISARMCVWS